MKLLVYGINYHPELTGIGKYTTEMCEYLTSRGHEVEVITAMPYYPEWRIHSAYRRRGWHTEMIEGVKVHRVPVYVPNPVTGGKRLLHDFSFLLSSCVPWVKALFSKFDVVLCIYPPLPIGVFPLLYGFVTRTPYQFHVQDLQVDAARELGLIKNETLLRILEGMEKVFLKHARRVTTISNGMARRLEAKGVSAEQMEILPNWVDTEALVPYAPEARARVKSRYGYQTDERVVLYSGNLGEKQGLDHLLRAAFALRDRSNIRFHIVGEGAAKARLVAMKDKLGLDNVRFAPLVPKSELPDLLNMADLHVILQSKGATDLVMPSKLGPILACGGVVLVAADNSSELAQTVRRGGFGVQVDSDDEKAFISSIMQLTDADAAESVESFSTCAREWASRRIGLRAILPNYEKMLTSTGMSAVATQARI